MKRHRRLRRLRPDAELIRRRAAGEPLRELAGDYDVSHTTLSRYFRRPGVSKQLKQAEQLARAERRAAEARWRAEQKAARQARRNAAQQAAAPARAAAGREADTGSDGSDSGSRTAAGASPAGRILRPARTYSYPDWLDEHDAPPAPPDPPVKLVSENGETVASTAASNADRMAAALAPHYGPLTVAPA